MTIQETRVFFQDWFCGCGMPENAIECLRDLLALHPLYDNRPAFESKIPDDGLQYLVLYTLDHFGLTEHGTGIGGAWLTPKGQALLGALKTYSSEDVAKSCCIHGYVMDISEDEFEDCPECK